MIKNYFDSEHPIIVGLAGKAGSGKTSVAEYLVPKGSASSGESSLYGLKWDHIFFALPLYELSSIRRSIKGFNEANRQLYAIYNVLYEIYGGSPLGVFPTFEEMVERTNKIFHLPIEPEGVKPRGFLQGAGDICRDGYEDCFAKWGVNKSNKIHQEYLKSLNEDQDPLDFVVIISDVRMINEAEHILAQPNGLVVCFDAEKETLDERILKRDGRLMTESQSSHRSEQEMEIVKEIASCVIKTDSMSIEDQAKETVKQLGILKEANA
jgi:dephospho-CoA kinase